MSGTTGDVALARGELTQLLEEQAALRRLATLVAQQPSPEEIFAAVAEAVGSVLGADMCSLLVFPDDVAASVVGSWSREPPIVPVGTALPLDSDGVVPRIFHFGKATRLDNYQPGAVAEVAKAQGIRSAVGAPVVVGGKLWGALAAAVRGDEPLPDDAEARIAAFSELVAIAISNADTNKTLERFAAEQAALRRIATLVAQQPTPAEVFAAVAEAVGSLLAIDVSAISVFSDGAAKLVASWSREEPTLPVGLSTPLDDDGVMARVFRSAAPARVDAYERGTAPEIVRTLGIRAAVGAPILVEGRLWGVLAAAVRGDHPLAEDAEARIAAFTELVATAVANATARAELVASRARIVAAGDEARQRIERNLHDGVQQGLVALLLDVRARADPDGEGDTDATLLHVEQDLETILEDLREISHGLHPPLLSRLGLGPSLAALARRSPIPVDLAVDLPERPSGSLETALYYAISESMTNAASIVDDGVGGAHADGSGLVGLRDRVEALGGRFVLDSRSSAGTTISIELPMHPAAAS